MKTKAQNRMRCILKSIMLACVAGAGVIQAAQPAPLSPAHEKSRFAVEPQLGSLEWACATMPPPHGDIGIFADSGRMLLRLPRGTTAIMRGQTLAGPGDYTLKP